MLPATEPREADSQTSVTDGRNIDVDIVKEVLLFVDQMFLCYRHKHCGKPFVKWRRDEQWDGFD